MAAARGEAKVLDILLKNNAEVNLIGDRSPACWSPASALVLASRIGNKKKSESAIGLLVDAGADLNATDTEGGTALHAAALSGSMNVLKLLIKNNAKLDLQDDEGSTPLLLALLQSRHGVAKYLIESGADLNMKDNYGVAPIHVAISQGPTLLDTLLCHNLDVNVKDDEGRTALHLAVDDNYFSAVELLVAHNANVNISDEDGSTPLHLAKLNSNRGIFTMDEQVNVLQEALMEWKIDANEALSGQIAKESVLTEETQSMLQIAVISGRKQVVDLLIENGALLDAEDNSGCTPLHEAVMNGDFAKVLLLLERGADVKTKDNRERTPLRLAAELSNNEDNEIINLLRIYEQEGATRKAT